MRRSYDAADDRHTSGIVVLQLVVLLTLAADALELTVTSVSSALQRARVTMRKQLPGRRLDWRTPATQELSDDDRGWAKSYIDADKRNDLDGLASLLRDDLWRWASHSRLATMECARPVTTR